MIINMYRDDAKKAKQALLERFLNGEKLNIGQIVQEYFKKRSIDPDYLEQCRKIARSWISTLRGTAKSKYGLYLRSLDDQGNFGFASSEEEAKYVIKRAYVIQKGSIENLNNFVTRAQQQGVLKVNLVLDEPITLKRLAI